MLEGAKRETETETKAETENGEEWRKETPRENRSRAPSSSSPENFVGLPLQRLQRKKKKIGNMSSYALAVLMCARLKGFVSRYRSGAVAYRLGNAMAMFMVLCSLVAAYLFGIARSCQEIRTCSSRLPCSSVLLDYSMMPLANG